MQKFQSSAVNFASVRKSGVEAQVRLLLDRAEIADVVRRYGHSIDVKDFALHRSCYADEIEMHFKATVDIDRTKFTADEWMAMASKFHLQFDGAEHNLTPEGILVDGDSATCYVMMHASHFKRDAKGSPYQHIIGGYDMTFTRTADGWKICKAIQTVRWAEGNWQIHTDAGKVFGDGSDA